RAAAGESGAMRAAALGLIVLSLLAISCSRSSTKGGKRQFVVAFSQCNNAEPYRAAQNALMQKRFAEAGDVRLVISDAQQDNSKQIAQVETFIRERPDLLIVAPNERAALTAVMGEAMDAKIPVICLERDILQPYYTTYVHSDNVGIGRMAAEFIKNYLVKKYHRPKGNVVEMRGLLGVEGEISRHNGAQEVFKQYPDIKIVADPVAVGAYLAARELGREKEMIFVGVDGLGGPAGGIKKVMDGILAATFVYPLCVNQAVDVALHMLHDPGFQPQKQYVVPPQPVTPQNAAQL